MHSDYYFSSSTVCCDPCSVCFTPNSCDWGELYCSNACRAKDLSLFDRAKFLSELRLKGVKKERENLEQEARLLEFLTSHKPKYVPIADSVCFQWIQRQSYGKHSYFLGRWQKDKYFCFGRVVYDDNSNWAEALLELEKEMNSGNVDVPFEIIDHEGNAVRWEDFLYHALVSCGNYDPQADVERLSPCLFGQMHRYSYAGGINP